MQRTRLNIAVATVYYRRYHKYGPQPWNVNPKVLDTALLPTQQQFISSFSAILVGLSSFWSYAAGEVGPQSSLRVESWWN